MKRPPLKIFYDSKALTEEHDFEIMALDLMPDHVHLFVKAAPKWAPGKIVSIFKNITSKIIFEEFP